MYFLEKTGVKMEKIFITVKKNENKIKYEMQKGENLLTFLEKKGEADFFHCGKKGICGKCKIRFTKAAPLPLPSERKIFTPEQLREGYRLACLAKPVRDCEIELCFKKEKKITVVTSMTDVSDSQKDLRKDTDTIIAIDLGTTTVAMELRGKKTGQLYDTYCAINPQRSFGADVLSRIDAANKGALKELQELIQTEIETGILKLAKKAEEIGLCKPKKAFLAGNTTMGQLFMGYGVEKLGKYPFEAVDIKRNKLFLADTEIVVLPGISAFVGADIAAGIYYVNKMFQGFTDKQPSLLIDLGTNGEMALGVEGHILTTATAAGPAFEGGSTETIMGADMVACLDTLLKEKKLDETGLLLEPYFTEGVRVNQVFLKKEDIRALQMAKAAVFAGICILIRKYGLPIEAIHKVYLAGGFGYYLQVESAVSIGLLPVELKDKVVSAGNTALKGAFLQNQDESELEEIIKGCETINLAKEPDFEMLYLKAMELKPLSYKNFFEN